MEKAFINSVPKSGTNLAAKSLDLFGFQSAGHLGAEWILKRSAKRTTVKRLQNFTVQQGYLLGINHPVEVNRRTVNKLLTGVSPGQYLTAHVGYTSDLLQKVTQLDFKSILVIRDPRSIAASLVPYILETKSHPLNEAFQAMTEVDRYAAAAHGFFREGEISNQPVFICCTAVEPWFNAKHVLKVKFRDLVGPEGKGSRATRRKTLEKICDHIRAPESKIHHVEANLFGGGKQTFRSGQADAWRCELPKEVLRKMNELLEPVLERWGYQ
jgi:hypothetical protein